MDCDYISKLPDDLLLLILSFVTARDTVTTSVLSKRWKSLWLMVPGLDLESTDGPLYTFIPKEFINDFVKLNYKSQMKWFKFSFQYPAYTNEQLAEWIDTVIERKVQFLEIQQLEDRIGIIPRIDPHYIYKSNTLVSLKLINVHIKSFESSVSLPSLKILHLEDIFYDARDGLMDLIIPGCPVLEDLTLMGYLYRTRYTISERVKTQTLKRCRIVSQCEKFCRSSLEIDAPQLEYLSLTIGLYDQIMVKNLKSLLMVDIDSGYNLDIDVLSERDITRDLINNISSVKHMIISLKTLEVYT